jgi:hypothetical protein
MDFEWVAIALGDVAWISLAFALGFLARLISLPPLVGFLATGFALNYLGIASGEMLQKLADLGITLLLFTVGLKLNPKVLIRPQVWSVTALHISIIIALFGAVIFGLALMSVSLFTGLDLKLSLMLAFRGDEIPAWADRYWYPGDAGSGCGYLFGSIHWQVPFSLGATTVFTHPSTPPVSSSVAKNRSW